MKYRKKPVVVAAIQWAGNNWNEICSFMKSCQRRPKLVESRRIRVTTKECAIYAKETDFIIRGVEGEFYPCDEAIFHKTYEPASSSDELRDLINESSESKINYLP